MMKMLWSVNLAKQKYIPTACEVAEKETREHSVLNVHVHVTSRLGLIWMGDGTLFNIQGWYIVY